MSKSCYKDIEDFKGVDHLYFNDKSRKIPNEKEISFVSDLVGSYYQHKTQFNLKTQLLQKKYHIKPRQNRLNLIYRTLLQEKKILPNLSLEKMLISKKGRVNSGIQQISVLTSPERFSCLHDCGYCPNFEGMPRSYIPEEPACRRAKQNDFDACKQFWDRATSYSCAGHPVDKIELIILGGTWDNYDWEYRKEFVRDLFYAANTFYQVEKRERLSLAEEHTINESALCKIIGLTIETRPDYCNKPEYIKSYIELGVTRVQYGVQSIYDDALKLIKRGCKHKDTIEATKMIHESCFKDIIHIMPILPYPNKYDDGMHTCVEKDEAMFDYLMESEDCQADEWKIYPTSIPKSNGDEKVYNHTKIEDWFNEGKYIPYSNEDLIDLAVRVKKKLADKEMEHLRITRFIRDIPIGNIQGGASIPNMRQLVHKKCEEQGFRCPCIRCSEIKDREFKEDMVSSKIKKFKASGGEENFISFQTIIDGERYIIGFLRLRFSKDAGMGFMPVLKDSAMIRELHVYGNLNATKDEMNRKSSNSQHKGYGKKLMRIAENMAIENGYKKIAVISGVGVRNYYRKLGYELEEGYMTKKLKTKKKINDSFVNCMIYFPLHFWIVIIGIIYMLLKSIWVMYMNV